MPSVQISTAPGLIDASLSLQSGTPTQPVEAGYHANAWMILRHPDFDTLRGILNDVGETIRVRAR